MRHLTLAVAAFVLAISSPLAAQETPPAEAAAPESGEEVVAGIETPEEMSISILELQLKPLRKDEVAERLDTWLGHLRELVEAITANRIAAEAAEGEQRTNLDRIFTDLTRRRAMLIDRVEVVMASLESKGGDIEEARRYVAAVAPVEVTVDDTSALITYAKDWIVSPEGGIKVLKSIAFFIATLIAFWILARILGSITRRAVGRFKNASSLLKSFLSGMVRKATMLVGAVVAVSMLGVDIGPLVAAIGAAGLVIGFALQGTLSNFASGILILLYRPFDVGDFINAGGTSGTVEAMTLVSTTMLTPDNQQVVVPNNSIWGDVITNVTGRDTRRVDLVFGIGYGDDIEKARSILERVAKAHPMVLESPAPNIRVSELGDSSVNFIVRPWSKTSDYWDVYWDLHRSVKEAFDAEGISIPFPQRDVHVYQEKD